MGAKDIKQLSLAKTTRQSLLSLVFNLGGILAGLLVVTSLEIFTRETWIIALFPGILSMRGVIGGLFSGRLSTALHLGTIDPSLKSIKHHRNQITGAWIASIMMYVVYALVSKVFQEPFNVFATLRFISLLLATNVFAAIFMILISFSVSILTFYKGLDPDNFVIPIESSLADTITTISLLGMLSLLG